MTTRRGSIKAKQRNEAQAPPARSRHLWWLLSGIIVIALAVFAWRQWDRPPDIAVPEVDMRQASPALVERLTAARQAVVDQPRSADAWGELGMLLFAHQFEQETNTCLRQAARLNPDDFRWPYLLGVSLAVVHPDEAMAQFQRALELNGDLPVIRVRLGELLLQAERLDEAATQLETGADAAPGDPRVHFNLARLSLMRGDLERARQSAETAVSLAPDVRSVRELLAQILGKQGQNAAAQEQLALAQQAAEVSLGWLDPVAGAVQEFRLDATSRWEAAQTLLDAGRTDEAVRMLLQAIELDDRDPRIHALLARTLIQSNQMEGADQVIGRALQRHPESAELQFLLGSVEFFRGKWDDAEKQFVETIRLRPDHALGHYNLGHTRLKLNRPKDALIDFQTAARLKPDHADSHINCARLHLKFGDRSAAEDHFQQAQRIPTASQSELAKLRAELDQQ